MSLFYAPVTSTPTATCPVNRFPTNLSQRSHKTLVLTVLVSINDASSVLHFRSASQNTTDSIMYRLFLIRSIPWLLTTAPMGVLQPAPVCRLRKAFFHLTESISALFIKVVEFRTHYVIYFYCPFGPPPIFEIGLQYLFHYTIGGFFYHPLRFRLLNSPQHSWGTGIFIQNISTKHYPLTVH